MKLTVLLLLAIGTTGILIEKKICNFLTLYSYVWCIAAFLSGLHLYNQVPYSERVYFFIIIGGIGFAVGYYLLNFFLIPRKKLPSEAENFYRGKVNYNIWNLLLGICSLFYITIAIKVITLLSCGVSWYSVRYTYYEGGLLFRGIWGAFHTWIVSPICSYVSFPVLLAEVGSGNRNKVTIGLIFLNMVMQTFISGGKGNIVVFSCSLFLYFLFFYRSIGKKRRRQIIYAIVAVAVGAVGLQLIRSGKSEVAFPYGYIGITLPLMDYWTQYLDRLGVQANGLVFFYGLLNLPFSLFSKIGFTIPEFEEIGNLVDFIAKKGIEIFPSEGTSTNTYISLYTYFYVDFGKVGIFWETMLFGMMGKAVTGKLAKKQDKYHLAIFILFAYSIIESFIKWNYYKSSFVLAFMYIWVLYHFPTKIKFKSRLPKIKTGKAGGNIYGRGQRKPKII